MVSIILGFLSKIKLQHILIVAVVGLVLVAYTLQQRVIFHKSESARQESNFETLRDFDSLKVANVLLRTSSEIKEYVESNKDLNELIKDRDIKIKRLQSVIYQHQKYRDTVQRVTDVSEIVEDIRENVTSVVKWSDSTECLVVKGVVKYEDEQLSVNVTSREFTNKIAIIGTMERPQTNLFTRWFGKLRAKITVVSKCGDTETLIIERVKK